MRVTQGFYVWSVQLELDAAKETLRHIRSSINQIHDWSDVPGDVCAVIEHILDEIAKRVEV